MFTDSNLCGDLNETNIIADDGAQDEIVSSDADIKNDITTETDSGNTFTDLKNTISNAGNVVLKRDYEFDRVIDDGLKGIRITRDNVVIDGNDHYIKVV